MKHLLRLTGVIPGTLVGLACIGYGIVYALSERVMRHVYEVPRVTLSVPTDAASIAEGRRMAVIRACFGGCHGKDGEGSVLFDEPLIARLVAPNLTAAVREYGDAGLAGNQGAECTFKKIHSAPVLPVDFVSLRPGPSG
jgi:hypothetical protein